MKFNFSIVMEAKKRRKEEPKNEVNIKLKFDNLKTVQGCWMRPHDV